MPDVGATSAFGEQFHLPDLGEGLTEAEIVSWHVVEGGRVVTDQPLVAVETDKAVVEIPAPHAGRIARLNASVGERVQVGSVLVTFYRDGDTSEESAVTVVGELSDAPLVSNVEQKPRSTMKVSPRARQRARELNVDLSNMTATGPHDVIDVADVDRAAAAGTDERLRGIRQTMAARMSDADARVVRASLTDEANITQWLQDAQVMARVIRAIGVACCAQPLLNARFDDDALSLTPQTEVNLGIAMETEDGLFVPVLRDITELDAETISAELEQLKVSVERRSIDPDQLRGQTITLSNFGAVGGIHAEMVVVPPQVAIVGVGRIFERLVLVEDNAVENRFLPLSITFDHRVVTGVETCDFLNALRKDLELIN